MTLKEIRIQMTQEERRTFWTNISKSEVLRELPYETAFQGNIQKPKQQSMVSVTNIATKIGSLLQENEDILDKYDPKRTRNK